MSPLCSACTIEEYLTPCCLLTGRFKCTRIVFFLKLYPRSNIFSSSVSSFFSASSLEVPLHECTRVQYVVVLRTGAILSSMQPEGSVSAAGSVESAVRGHYVAP